MREQVLRDITHGQLTNFVTNRDIYIKKRRFLILHLFLFFLLKKYVKSTKQKSELYKAVLYLPKEVNSFYI